MASQSARLVEEMPHIEVRNGLFYLEATDGSRFVMSLHVAKAITRRSEAVLAIHDAEQADVVRPYRRRRKKPG